MNPCNPSLTEVFRFLAEHSQKLWEFLHWIHQEMEYWHWLLKWISPVAWFIGAIFGLKFWDRRKLKRRMNRVNARKSTFEEIQPLVQDKKAIVESEGITRTKRHGIAVVQIKITIAGRTQDFYFDIDPQNSFMLKGMVNYVDYASEGYVIFWVATARGDVPCPISIQ